jgi:hypothetical protein
MGAETRTVFDLSGNQSSWPETITQKLAALLNGGNAEGSENSVSWIA